MSGDTWQTMGVTYGKPCVHLHVFTRHMASHVSTCMEGASSINMLVRRRRRGEEERKREREERREKEMRKERRKERKKKWKRKRERGRRPAVSSSVHWRSDD